MTKCYFFLFVTSSLFLINSASAQSVSTPASEHKNAAANSSSADTSDATRSLTLEFDYGSNRGYQLQRRIAGADTSQKYISPTLTYEAKSGFFTSILVYKTPGAKKKWDEFLAELGWDFKISEDADIDGSASYTHYSYNQAIRPNGVDPFTSGINAYIKHDFDFIKLKLSGDYYFGGTYNDEDIIGDVDHAFYIDNVLAKKDEVTIDPIFTIICATLNYYAGNLAPLPPLPAGATKKQKDVEALAQATRQVALNDLGTLRIANYEFGLPVDYEIGKFDFEVAWRYYLPVNLPAVLNAKSYAYITASISYDFLK